MITAIIENAMETIKEEIHNHEIQLQPPSLNPLTSRQFHDALKKIFSSIALQIYKQFLSFFDPTLEFIDYQGKRFYYKFHSPKKFLTFFGILEIERSLYQAKDGQTYIPLDHHWGMSQQFATEDVRESVAFALAHLTQSESAQLLKKSSLFSISETGIRSITEGFGHFIEENQESLFQEIHQEEKEMLKVEEEKTDILVASIDFASMLVRDPKKERAEEELSLLMEGKTSKKYSRKMASVASISRYQLIEDEEKPEKNCLGSVYQARMPEEGWGKLKEDFERELVASQKNLENSGRKELVKIVLMDGQKSLWSYVKGKEEFNDFKKLIDYYHACEHLSEVVNLIFTEEWERNRWYKEWKGKLKKEENGVNKVLSSINYHKKARKLGKGKLSKIEEEEKYFINNKEMMNYNEFVAKGWPIGSGPVEAACKTIVKTRMCRSGMKWEHETGQNILSLRTLAKSGRWDYFWNAHLKSVA